MALPLFSCTLNDMYTSFCKPKPSSCDGFAIKARNLDSCQLGFSQNEGCKVFFTSRKYFSLEATGRSLSNVEDVEGVEEHSFTLSYLINSCGLSPELAISASKKVNFTTPDKPDSVLTLLRDYGFRSTHITELVRRAPGLLLARPETTLIPKLEFFRSMGIPDCVLPRLCSSCPNMFRYGLKQRIIPCCDFLESVLPDKKVTSVLKGGPTIFEFDVQLRLAPNIEILRQMGATPSVISCMLITYPTLLNLKSDKFTARACELIRLGFKPSRLSFAQALFATTMINKANWESKVKVYKSWGCSDNDVSRAFRKFPVCMLVSEKKIMHGMEFLVNELGLEHTEVLRNPTLLCYSLKRRLIPRYSVIRVLQLKGLLNKDLCLASSIYPSEKRFLEKYVTKYKEQVPQLLSVYQGGVGLRELGFGPENIRRIANTSLSNHLDNAPIS